MDEDEEITGADQDTYDSDSEASGTSYEDYTPFSDPDLYSDVKTETPAYYDALSKLVLMNKIIIANPVSHNPLSVESATLIGYQKDNQAVIMRLLDFVDSAVSRAHAGIYNNLACARAWNGEYGAALVALQLAVDPDTPDHSDGTRQAKKIIAGNVALIKLARDAAEG